jgi:hypothetical protein
VNWDLIFKGITLCIVLANNIAIIVMWLRRRNDQRISKVEAEMAKLKETDDAQGARIAGAIAERKEQHAAFVQRLALAEQSIKHMPTHEDLRRISDRLGSLEKDVGSIDTKTDGIQETVNTIRDLLLEKGV